MPPYTQRSAGRPSEEVDGTALPRRGLLLGAAVHHLLRGRHQPRSDGGKVIGATSCWPSDPRQGEAPFRHILGAPYGRAGSANEPPLIAGWWEAGRGLRLRGSPGRAFEVRRQGRPQWADGGEGRGHPRQVGRGGLGVRHRAGRSSRDVPTSDGARRDGCRRAGPWRPRQCAASRCGHPPGRQLPELGG